MRKKLPFLLAAAMVWLLWTALPSQCAMELAAGVLRAHNWIAIDCPDLAKFEKSRLFAGPPWDNLRALCSDLTIVATLALNAEGTPALREVIITAELKASVTADDLKRLFPNVNPFDMAVPSGLALTPLGSAVFKDLPFPIYLVQAFREGHLYLLGASHSRLLIEMAQRKDLPKMPRHIDSPLWIMGHFSPKSLKLDNGLSAPLEFEIGLEETPQSITCPIWANMSQISRENIFHFPPEGFALTPPLLMGQGTLYGFIALDNSWMPEDMTPDQLAAHLLLDDATTRSLKEGLMILQLFTGLEWQDVCSVIRGSFSLNLHGSVPTPLGSFPALSFYASGASETTARVVFGMARIAAKSLDIPVIRTDPAHYGGWEGIALVHPGFPGAELILAHSEKGLAAAVTEAGKNPFVESELVITPELRQLIRQGRPALLYGDISATLPLFSQVLEESPAMTRAALGDIERLIDILGQWKYLTCYSVNQERGELKLFFAQERRKQCRRKKVNLRPVKPLESDFQRLSQLVTPLFESVSLGSDGELMIQTDGIKFYLREDTEEKRLTFYCGLSASSLTEEECYTVIQEWPAGPSWNSAHIVYERSQQPEESGVFWISQSLSLEKDNGDLALMTFARGYYESLRLLMKRLGW